MIGKLPDDRVAYTRKFTIPVITDHPDGTKRVERFKFYVTAGCYPDGTLGEIFVRVDKTGSFTSGALDAFAMAVSIGLQHGVPLELLLGKLRHSKFEPAGFTGDAEFPSCSSALDLLAQWLLKKFSEQGSETSAAK